MSLQPRPAALLDERQAPTQPSQQKVVGSICGSAGEVSNDQEVTQERLLLEMARKLRKKCRIIIHDTSDNTIQPVAQLLPNCSWLQELTITQEMTLKEAHVLKDALPLASLLRRFRIGHQTNRHAEKPMQLILQGVKKSVSMELLHIFHCSISETKTFALLLKAVWEGKLTYLILGACRCSKNSASMGKLLEMITDKISNTESNTGDNFYNSQLKRLELSPAGNEVQGAVQSLAEALRKNTVLEHLNFSGLKKAQVKPFADMLPFNDTLRRLNFYFIDEGQDTYVKDTLDHGMDQNSSVLSITLSQCRPPNVVQWLGGREFPANKARMNWNNTNFYKWNRTFGKKKKRTLVERELLAHTDSNNTSNRVSRSDPLGATRMLPYYLARVSAKPCVLYLALKENAHLWLPYNLGEHEHEDFISL